MSSTCFEPEGSSSGRRLYIQVRYCVFYVHQYKQCCVFWTHFSTSKVHFVGLYCIIILQCKVQKYISSYPSVFTRILVFHILRSTKLDHLSSILVKLYRLLQWPRGLRRGSAASRLPGLRVLIPPGWGGGGAWLSVSLVSVVCCQVEVSASGWSFVQRSPTDCGVSGCDRGSSVTRKPSPTRGCFDMALKNGLLHLHVK
jgi:hypothetical protein